MNDRNALESLTDAELSEVVGGVDTGKLTAGGIKLPGGCGCGFAH